MEAVATSEATEKQTLAMRLAQRWPRLFSATAVKSVVALTDQAVVSGTSFLTTILIARAAGPDQLGLYVLGTSLIMFVLPVQQSLVMAPYTVYCRRVASEDRLRYSGSVLLHFVGLAILAAIGLTCWGAALALGLGKPSVAPVAWVVAGIIPFVLLRDFARSFGFAHLNVRMTCAMDVGVATLQVAGLFALAATGLLGARSALAVIGVASLIGAGTWLTRSRHLFAPHVETARGELARNWRFARWIFAGEVVSTLNSDVFIVWLLEFSLGKSATGIFAACATVVFFANPFVLGVASFLTPRIAQAYADGGVSEVRRVAAWADAIVAVPMAIFCGIVFFFGNDLLHVVYGDEYVGHGYTAFVLALAIFAATATMGSGKGLWVLDRPDVNLRARLLGLAVTISVSLLLVERLGLTGVAWGWFAGCSADSFARWYAFRRLTRDSNAGGAA